MKGRWFDVDHADTGTREVDARLAERALWTSMFACPVMLVAASVLALWLHSEGVADRGIIGWLATIVVAEVAIAGVSWWGTRSPGRLMRALGLVMVGTTVAMVMCAVLPLWDGDLGGRTDIPLVYQLWVCGTAASAMTIAGPVTRLFVAGPVVQLAVNTALILTGVASVARPLGALSFLYIIVLAFSHAGVRQAMRKAVANELRAQELLDELAGANDALAHEATHDLLTGIANRRRIIAELADALRRIGKDRTHLTVLFMDLDGFKEVNDTYGHAVGDDLLSLAAKRIAAELGTGDLVGRQGGDEFIVLVRSADRPGAHAIAEAVRAGLETTFRVGEHLVSVSVSIGLVWCDTPGLVADEVLRRADLALYRAKERGRNCVIEYARDNPVMVDDRVRPVQELREALRQEQIRAWYQPVVDMETGEIIGAEALARWPQPDGSVLMPGHFLRALTEAGLDTDLGIHMALQIIAFRTGVADVVPSRFRVGLNVAFRRTRASDVVEALAGMHGIVMSDGASVLQGITIELTENAAVRDLDETRRALERARSLGLRIALDDFGTGHSSLTLVRQLPLDVIKLDRAFVHGVADDRANQAVVAAVVDLAAGVGASVVAEGVERVDDAIELGRLGCRYAQGFLYSPAVPGDVLRGWMEHGAPWQAPPSRTPTDASSRPVLSMP